MTEHYFSETPHGEMRHRHLDVFFAGAERRITTAGGVFSADGLDRGTAILLRALESGLVESVSADSEGGAPVSSDGPILDLGCGWGPIALSAALRNPHAEVWAVDINARARELAAINARDLKLTNMRVAAPEEVPGDLTFAQLHSNPPIRVGKDALHAMLSQWLPRLRSGGSAHLVVAKHLGADSLQRWIADTFPELSVARTARDKGFHVISAVRS